MMDGVKTASLNSDVLGLKLWYEDGTVIRIPFDRISTDWAAAPQEGLQVVSIYDKTLRPEGYYAQWFAGYDRYAMTETEIIETNIPGEIPDGASVKFGSQMDKDAFRTLYNTAMKDRDF